MDPLSETLATAEACLQLKKHRKILGCHVDYNCIRLSYSSSLYFSAEQLLSTQSDISGRPEKEQVATRYISLLNAHNRREDFFRWSFPGGLHPVRSFPRHILPQLYVYHMYLDLLDTCVNFQVTIWSKNWSFWFAKMDFKHLLVEKAAQSGVAVEKSIIKHKNEVMGIFPAKHVRLKQLLSCYCASLVYSNLSGKPQKYITSEETALSITMDVFEKWAYQIVNEVLSRKGTVYKSWVEPSPCCASRNIDHPR